jgi:hypothetical protein
MAERPQGIIVSGGQSQGDDFEERARRHNSTLQTLIEAIGAALAASRELLARLPRYLRDDTPGRGSAQHADRPPESPGDKSS